MSELDDRESIEARVREMLTPHRLGLAKMVDSARKAHQSDFSAEERVGLLTESMKIAGFTPELLIVLLALAVDQLGGV